MHMNAITADLKKFCDLSFRGWWLLRLLQCFGVWHHVVWHMHMDVSEKCSRSSRHCCWGVMQYHWVTAWRILFSSSSTVNNAWQAANILLKWLFCMDCHTFMITPTGSFIMSDTNTPATQHIPKGSNPQFQETHRFYIQNKRLICCICTSQLDLPLKFFNLRFHII